MTRRHSDEGSAALELALIGVVFIILAVVIVGAGRFPTGKSEVFNAAHIAAREAARSPTAERADDIAEQSVRTNLASTTCDGYTIDVDASGFVGGIRPDGTVQPGYVAVEVACEVDLGSIGSISIGRGTVRARAVGAVDVFRSST